jgi:hypothetical protein
VQNEGAVAPLQIYSCDCELMREVSTFAIIIVLPSAETAAMEHRRVRAEFDELLPLRAVICRSSEKF